MHHCEKCGSVQLQPDKRICEACRTKPPRKCKTCGNPVTGRKMYCDECASPDVKAVRKWQKEHPDYWKSEEPTPPTSLDWLNGPKGFNAVLRKNNGVYVPK